MKIIVLYLIVFSCAWSGDLSLFDYEHTANKFSFKVKRAGWWKDVLQGTLNIKDPITGKEIKVVIDYYRLKTFTKKPIIFLFPSISRSEGTAEIVEQTMAVKISNKGYHAVICYLLDDIADASRPVSGIDDFFRRTIISHRHTLNKILERPEVDPKRAFVMGASLGGIISSLYMSVEPRIRKGYVYVAGGNLPEIMSNSVVKLIENYRKAKIDQLGLAGKEEFYEVLKRQCMKASIAS